RRCHEGTEALALAGGWEHWRQIRGVMASPGSPRGFPCGRGGVVRKIGKHPGARDLFFAAPGCARASLSLKLQLALAEARFYRRRKAALGFELTEKRPRFRGELPGQRLNIGRACGGVGDGRKIAFLLKNKARAARKPARKGSGCLGRTVER